MVSANITDVTKVRVHDLNSGVTSIVLDGPHGSVTVIISPEREHATPYALAAAIVEAARAAGIPEPEGEANRQGAKVAKEGGAA